jgi:hypothetical protein
VRANKYSAPSQTLEAPETTKGNACESEVCKERLHTVLSQIQLANQAVRSLLIQVEEERLSATRHLLHLDALTKYRIDNNLDALAPEDVKKFFEEDVKRMYEKRRVLSEEPDVEMQGENPTITAPSTNNSLTSQSLSFNGFSDSDSDYVP